MLAPAPTDYRKTILYNTYDVTPQLQKKNAIGVTLGNGRFYTMRQNYKPYKIWMPVPKREREVNKNLSQNPGYTQTI